jgi:PAS domain S-box-containing protein
MITTFEVHLLGYKVTEQIYSGRRTLVYRGIREQDQKPVVIKLMRSEYPNFAELLQFRNQYIIAKNLDFAGIVKPYSLEKYRNGYALVMEDFGGISLKRWQLDKENIQQKIIQFLEIAIEVTHILNQLHCNHVIHKDIKPDNILINPETKQVKIIDFSIASLLPKEVQEIQNPNVLEGTLAYLSPEQTGRMNQGIDYRTDFYSLGVTFYEILTRKLPFESNEPMEIVHAHLAKQAIPPSQVNPDIPEVISQIITKLMAKNVEERYQSTIGLKYDLEICLQKIKETSEIPVFEIAKRDIKDHFIIPEKLYGRQEEVKTLLLAFERIANGSSELILVAGFSGIGKSAVVNEVHKPIVKKQAYFIKGKFDQFNRHVPFSAFVQAFRDLVRQLLTESDKQIKQWKVKILAALGENGQIIVDVIPELEKIIGSQPPVPELSGTAAQNRFHLLLEKFLLVFRKTQHPLVIFLDDLQWADMASLQLMQLLMSEANRGYLLFIGAYRDHEVSPAHPLMLTLDDLRKSGAIINIITLQPLSLLNVNQLVTDTLGGLKDAAWPLTEKVYQKTQGNPFFITLFLKALYQDGLIRFNVETDLWECNITQLNQQVSTANVVNFMTFQLRRLPLATQEILQLAACIGNQFNLTTLAIISQQSEFETATHLWKALQSGVILPTSNTYKFYIGQENQTIADNVHETPSYKFLHDRIQQAAYSLIAENQKQFTHLRIGQLLLWNSSSREKEEKLFEIVNHLNVGSALITDSQERENLAQLNLKAGRKAKTSTAYGVAVEYFAVGIKLLPPDAWESQYELTLALYQEMTEAAYLNTDFDEMEQWVNVVLQHALTLLDSIPVYITKMTAARGQGYPLTAINTGLQVLHRLGIEFPQSPTSGDIESAGEATKLLWFEHSPLKLLDLPPMSDAHHLAAINIMSRMVPSAYLAKPTLMPLLIFKQVEYSIKYGNCPVSVYAYADYGIILCGMVGALEAGYEFGQLALKLLDKLQCKTLTSRAFFIVHNFIQHWQQPLGEILAPLLEGYQSGLETGDIECTALNAQAYCHYAYFAGRELTELAKEMAAYCQTIDSLKQESVLQYLKIAYQVVLNLLGGSEFPERLTGKVYNAEQWLPVHETDQDRTALFYWQVNQTILWYLFGEYQQAAEQSAQAEKYLDAGISQYPTFLYPFYDALILLALYQEATEENKQQILQRVETHQQKIHRWARLASYNHQHRWELVEAERYAVLNNRTEAIEFYDIAIASAKANGYIQEEALANELAAKFYLAWGKEKVASSYIQEAYYCYARWGAKAKINYLEQLYPQLLQPIIQQQQNCLNSPETITSLASSKPLPLTHSLSTRNTSSSVSDVLDFTSILKAAQTISSSIELDQLIASLTRIILENSGAKKSVLILPQDDTWQVRAITFINYELNFQGEIQTIIITQPVDTCQDIPIKLINYVKNTQETVVIDNLQTDISGVIEEYMFQHQPRSVLCKPILNQGHLVGILYLENKLTQGIFTHERLLVLNFLCTQVAVSLENAQLYTNLQASEARFHRLAENVPGMIYQFQLSPDGTPRFNYVSPGCYEIYKVLPEQVIADINSLTSLTHPEDKAHYQNSIEISAQTLEPWRYEGRIITPSGELKWIQAASRPEKQVDGTIVWDGLLLDVTERKKAEAAVQQKSQQLEQALQNLQQAQLQIVQSEKMSALGNLVAGVAHEMNNPLGFITATLEQAKPTIIDIVEHLRLYQETLPNKSEEILAHAEEIDLDYSLEDLPKMIDTMVMACERLKNISTSLRIFSRADKDYKVPFKIHEGLDSTILILKHRLKANEKRPAIEVITEYGNLPSVECFPGQLNQVFMNILANAIDALDESNTGRNFEEIKANPNRITVTTSISEDSKQVFISIKDNGKGMTEEVKQRIFEHLFTTKDVNKGTGLGLAIAKQIIVEKHKGSIKVNSTPGEGAEFIIAIPLSC